MATKDRVTIELYVDDQGTVKIRNATAATQELTNASTAGSAASAAAGENFAAGLARQLGIYALVTTAAYKLGDAIISGFKAGIQAVDDYKLATIGVAATITDLAKDQSQGQENYSRALAYSQGMFNELELAAAKHFATGKDMTQAWNILTQKGIVLRKEEIDHLGVIVDKVKLATAGQVGGIQIAQELRAIFSGQARATDQVAMILKDKLGPAWEDVVKKVRDTGSLKPLSDEFQGLVFANENILKTYNAQKNTLDTLLTQVGRAGLAGAYADITELLTDINAYLEKHGDTIADNIYSGWRSVRETVESVAETIVWINNLGSSKDPEDGLTAWRSIAKALDTISIGIERVNADSREFNSSVDRGWEKWNQWASSNFDKPIILLKDRFVELLDWQDKTRQWNILVDESGLRSAWTWIEKIFDTVSQPITWVINVVSGGDGGAASRASRRGELLSAEGEDMSNFEGLPGGKIPAPLAPKTGLGGGGNGGGSGGGGKGGGGSDGTDRMRSIIDRLQQDLSKLTEGSIAEIDAWAVKTIADIEKVGRKGAETAEALALTAQVAGAKKAKVEDDFTRLVAKESGDQYAELDARYNDDLKKYHGITGAKEALDGMWYKRKADLDNKFTQEALSLQKGYLDQLSQATPFLAEQLALKEKSLAIEVKINAATLEEKILKLEAGRAISQAQAQEMRGLAALTEQAKKYALEREKWATQGVAGGMKIITQDLRKEGETWVADSFVNGFKNARSFMEDSLSGVLKGMLHGEKTDIKKFGLAIGDSIIDGMVKTGSRVLTKFFGKTLEKALTDIGGEAAGKAVGETLGGTAGKAAGDIAGGMAGKGTEAAAAAELMAAATALIGSSALLDGSSVLLDMSAMLLSGSSLLLDGSTVMLDISAGMLSASALMLSEAALALTIAAPVDAIPILHGGGMIAHSGLLVAHNGLAPDERMILAQTGEGIIKRSTMAEYARQGISFDMLNSGRLPVIPVPAGGQGGGGGSVTNVSVNVPQQVLQRLDRRDIRRSARDIVRETEREMRRLGRG